MAKPAFTSEEALNIARFGFGFENAESVIPLPSYDDQNKRIVCKDGSSVVLKFAASAAECRGFAGSTETLQQLELENESMVRIFAGGVACPLPLPVQLRGGCSREGSSCSSGGGGKAPEEKTGVDAKGAPVMIGELPAAIASRTILRVTKPNGGGGGVNFVRAVPFLDGAPLALAAAPPPAACPPCALMRVGAAAALVGASLRVAHHGGGGGGGGDEDGKCTSKGGRLRGSDGGCCSLVGWDPPAARRRLTWDLANAGEAAAYVEDVASAADRTLAAKWLRRFAWAREPRPVGPDGSAAGSPGRVNDATTPIAAPVAATTAASSTSFFSVGAGSVNQVSSAAYDGEIDESEDSDEDGRLAWLGLAFGLPEQVIHGDLNDYNILLTSEAFDEKEEAEAAHEGTTGSQTTAGTAAATSAVPGAATAGAAAIARRVHRAHRCAAHRCARGVSILDLGDMCWSARCFDVAICLAYACQRRADPEAALAAALALLDGFQRACGHASVAAARATAAAAAATTTNAKADGVPSLPPPPATTTTAATAKSTPRAAPPPPQAGLTAAEAAALPVCVAARLAMSVLTSAHAVQRDPENAAYLSISAAPGWELLRQWDVLYNTGRLAALIAPALEGSPGREVPGGRLAV